NCSAAIGSSCKRNHPLAPSFKRNHSHKMKKSLLFIFLLVGAVSRLFAQEISGSMSGLIVDNTNAFLGGVTVIAVHIPTGTRYVTTTSSYGRFNLANLRVGGPYTITVSYAGMKTQTKTDITVSLGTPTVADFIMVPESKSMT